MKLVWSRRSERHFESRLKRERCLIKGIELLNSKRVNAHSHLGVGRSFEIDSVALKWRIDSGCRIVQVEVMFGKY